MAFTDKVKFINARIPEKVKIFIEKNFIDELKYFKKKYSFEVNLLSEEKFIIPEYKIDLLNKSKKIINSFENINLIIENNKSKSIIKDKKRKNTEKTKERKVKKTKSKKKNQNPLG